MKNKILLIIFLLIFFTSCTTVKYVTVPLSTPPEPYSIAEGQIKTQKDLFKEYQKALIKLNEWEAWYSIQTNINKKK
ncbi:hypothetical protein R4Q14_14315 [Brachyspira intermedia]|uniref:hypothetical protein n=1 Tax=Brachyspira intermedia TaxID=84377 RepID=UPI003007EAAD